MNEPDSQRSCVLVPGTDLASERLVLRQQGVELGALSLHWYTGDFAALCGPNLTRTEDPSVGELLLTEAAGYCRQRNTRLLTTLRDTRDAYHAKLNQLGFFPLARISFQFAPEARLARAKQPAIHLQPVTAQQRDRWVALLQGTFVETQDCPQLRQLMSAADTMACFERSSLAETEWFIAVQNGQDVACLILGFAADEPAAEILYLGVVPVLRGHQYGRQLVRGAFEIARRRQCRRVTLGVDLANRPAVNLYEQCGFFEYDQRDLWACAP